MINWNYDEFFEYYKNIKLINNDKVKIFEIDLRNEQDLQKSKTYQNLYEKSGKPAKSTKFFIENKSYNITQVNNLISTETIKDENYIKAIPKNLYLVFRKDNKDNHLKRFYFLFPDYIKGKFDKEEKIVANHYTFLLNENIVNLHLTEYLNEPGTLEKGYKRITFNKLPKEFEFSLNQPICKDFNFDIYNKVADDLIKQPYIHNGGVGKLTLQKTKLKKQLLKSKIKTPVKKLLNKSINKNINNELRDLLFKNNVTNITAVGLKLNNSQNYTYTVFIELEYFEDEDVENVDDDDYDEYNPKEYKPILSSFVFDGTSNYNSFEKHLTKLIKEWTQRYNND